MIDRLNKHLSLTRQCQLLGLSRSSLYYQPATDNTKDLALMARIDRQFLETPYYCQRRMKFRQFGRSKIPQFGRAVISRLRDLNSCLWAGGRGAWAKAAGVRAV